MKKLDFLLLNKTLLKSALQSTFVGILLVLLMAFKAGDKKENINNYFFVTVSTIAEADQTICVDNISLTGEALDLPELETGLWTFTSGGGTFDDDTPF